MTKAEIIAELRRSAVESRALSEVAPDWWGITLWPYQTYDELSFLAMSLPDRTQFRTFFLLVACALEDEC